MSDIDIWQAINELRKEIARLKTPDALLRDNGTYTPTYNGTTPGTTTYTTQEGSWVRLGNVLIARAVLVWTGATGTGNVRLGGLPVAAASDVSFPVETANVTFANGSIQGFLVAGSTTAQLISPATNAGGTELSVEAAGVLRYTIVYFV